MIAVIFEVIPKPGMAARYFEIAAQLKPMLDTVDGFISIERFESVAQPGKFLSLSVWRDEEAVRAWRTHTLHRSGQQEGRSTVFTDYRLRVAAVVRDYGMMDRAQAPQDSLNYFL
jgi:heme-degrading monooxygenase HmoA